jgi:hypothetical protein
MDTEIRSNGRNTGREGSSVVVNTIFETRDDGTQYPIGKLKQYFYAMDLELRIHMPVGVAGSTYTETVEVSETSSDDGTQRLVKSPYSVSDEETIENELTATDDPITEEQTFRYPTVRGLGRIVADALAHFDPADGGYAFPDPRPADDPDRNPNGVLPNIDELRIGQSGDRTRGGADADLRTWYQRVSVEWYRLVPEVERDGPVPLIEEVRIPGLDDWEPTGDEFPGTVTAREPEITPDDV